MSPLVLRYLFAQYAVSPISISIPSFNYSVVKGRSTPNHPETSKV